MVLHDIVNYYIHDKPSDPVQERSNRLRNGHREQLLVRRVVRLAQKIIDCLWDMAVGVKEATCIGINHQDHRSFMGRINQTIGVSEKWTCCILKRP